jgi:signal transduction histidine kinase/CheY-like chemotaxis protein
MLAFRRKLDGVGAKDAAIGVALCAVYLVCLWGSESLGSASRVPPLWPGNAVVAAMMVVLFRSPVRRPAILAALATSALFFAHIAPNWLAFARVFAVNAIEGLLAGWLTLWVLGPRRLLRSTLGFVRVQFLAVLPAALVACALREGLLRLGGGSDHVIQMWRGSLLPHFLGAAILLPALLLLFQPSLVPGARRSRFEILATMAALGLVAYLVFYVLRMPTAFALSPLLLLSAFRCGPKIAVFGHLLVALLCLPATITGGGTFTLHPEWGLDQRVLIYQGVLLSSVFGVSLCAFMVSDQARLRRLLTARAVSARAARLRALQASRAKSDFLATMSHEIRTPLNSVLGFTQLLLQSPGVSPAAREHVKMIAEAGGSLMTVLNDVLDFSKVEAGQIELHLEPVDVCAVSEAAAEIIRASAKAKGLALRLETDGIEGRFELDGQRLRQVLLNLLNNAVKFTQEGHVRLTASADAAGSRLRFEVADTGIGIDEDVIGRLFTRFSQADSSTTRHYGGSGLGLAICKGLVERMGGVIGVDSRLGHGSCFWFELPTERMAGEGAAADAEPTGGRLHGRVLLVDDHPMNLHLGETLLGLLGCEVDLAASGEEALAAARAKTYDAVLMDVHMPGMDGLAAARAIRALGGHNAATPIIAMSADVMPQSVERCRAAGMVDHVAKPIQIKALHEVLQRRMDDQKRRSAA